MKVTTIEPDSIAEDLGLQAGDELLEINGRKVLDAIDFRFHESDPVLSLKIAREKEVTIYDIEKDEGERIGLDFEEMKILACGNDCIFCFVDQNPQGLRKDLYFRDGDYRLSFMYGNYTTMTNAGPAILNRIVRQRLSPQYISVHVTDFETRKLLMGLKKEDYILEKIKFLHDNDIDMHTQIVLCPGINDGDVLAKTIFDLHQFHKRIISLAIVPVGLTDHRFGLYQLGRIDRDYATELLTLVEAWQEGFHREIGRNFVYPSDEFYILAGKEIPGSEYYNGFPQIENGVGLVRVFLEDFKKQAKKFPKRLASKQRLTMVTAELPEGIIAGEVLPRLQRIANLEVRLEVVPNMLYGRSVTVAGLLSGKCISSALSGKDCGDMLLLPPEVLNTDGLFLDDSTLPQLEERLSVPAMVYDGNWGEVVRALTSQQKFRDSGKSLHARSSLPLKGR
jgi:putative radical SAM enzyme (TIGR03279 family)